MIITDSLSGTPHAVSRLPGAEDGTVAGPQGHCHPRGGRRQTHAAAGASQGWLAESRQHLLHEQRHASSASHTPVSTTI